MKQKNIRIPVNTNVSKEIMKKIISARDNRLNYSRGIVLNAIARALPYVGRDFDVDVSRSDGGSCNLTGRGDKAMPIGIRIRPKTDMGRAIAPILHAELPGILELIAQERTTNNGIFPSEKESTAAPDNARLAHAREENDGGPPRERGYDAAPDNTGSAAANHGNLGEKPTGGCSDGRAGHDPAGGGVHADTRGERRDSLAKILGERRTIY